MRPELIIGLVGPIGCEITAVEKALEAAFKQVDYKTKGISLSEGIAELLEEKTGARPALSTLSEKIEAGNEVRRTYSKNGILAAFSITKIRELRASINAPVDAKSATGADLSALPADAVAYIIRQFKRPEEIELMRKTYGKAFIQVSIAQERNARISNPCLSG